MKKRIRLEHSYHNESVSNLLHFNGAFPDWVVTSAFYSALHFVSYHIFPLKIIHSDGSEKTLNKLEDYKSYYNHNGNKHTILSDLVFEHLPSISTDYDMLLDRCRIARYFNYKTNSVTANKALENLQNIKKEIGLPDSIADVDFDSIDN